MFIVSACLMGINCKYNGNNNLNQAVLDYLKDKSYIMVCPEEMAGLGTPRPPCEIVGGDGKDIFMGTAWVINERGDNVTEQFIKGARMCLALAEKEKCTMAILKAFSPSCGSGFIYDGTFSHKVIPGDGVTSALLKLNRIRVMTEQDIEDLG